MGKGCLRTFEIELSVDIDSEFNEMILSICLFLVENPDLLTIRIHAFAVGE